MFTAMALRTGGIWAFPILGSGSGACRPWANSLTVLSTPERTVERLSTRDLLFRADAELQVAEFSRGKSHGADVVGGAGALGAGRAWAALALGEACHDQRGRGGRGGRVGAVPARAHLSLRTGDLLIVVVDVEVVPGEALASTVLAGGVALQRPGDGDLVSAGSRFQVGQRRRPDARRGAVHGGRGGCGCRAAPGCRGWWPRWWPRP